MNWKKLFACVLLVVVLVIGVILIYTAPGFIVYFLVPPFIYKFLVWSEKHPITDKQTIVIGIILLSILVGVAVLCPLAFWHGMLEWGIDAIRVIICTVLIFAARWAWVRAIAPNPDK